MNNQIHLVKYFVSLFFLCSTIFAQLELSVYTDKDSYEYGEEILLFCKVTNITDTTFEHWASSYQSCQAEFEFNNFKSWEHTGCLTMTELLTYKPHTSKIYSWKIDPMISGLPNIDGIQMIVGKYFFDLVDTVYINAPQFLGGQVSVGFISENTDTLQKIKDSLNIVVLNHYEFSGRISETWQVIGYQIDSIISRYDEETVFNYIEKAVFIQYESIRTVNPLNYYPLHVGNKWILTGYSRETLPPYSENSETMIVEVGKDTVMNNGLKYFKVSREVNGNLWEEVYKRVDVTSQKVFIYDENSDSTNYEKVLFDLKMVMGDTLRFGEYEHLTVFNEDLISWNENNYESKFFEYIYGLIGFGERYLSEIGLYEYISAGDFFHRSLTLKGCIINNNVYGDTILVSVDEESTNLPKQYSLSQNYPNPFNPSTIIKYSIPINMKRNMLNVRLNVYDILGREVATLVNEEQSTGNYEVQFDASELTSGIYFYKLQSGDFVESKKMILIR